MMDHYDSPLIIIVIIILIIIAGVLLEFFCLKVSYLLVECLLHLPYFLQLSGMYCNF